MVADKFTEDDQTFKTERSRMMIINNLTIGDANGVIRSRYQSETRPYSCAAEMVQTLTAVYHNNNQASEALWELAGMRWAPVKHPDINRFIAKIAELCDLGNIVESERKSTLYEHIPKSLDPRLMGESTDPQVSYKIFAANGANAALAKQQDYDDSQRARRKHGSDELKRN